jgi:ketosteroid isomerase-like protein
MRRSSVPKLYPAWILGMMNLIALSTGQGMLHATPAPACNSPHAHELDFWVGDWDVFDSPAATKSVAHVRVERILGACALREDYEDSTGLKGQSLSLYDQTRGLWHQSWVTNRGQLLTLEGTLKGETLTLNGVDRTTPEGTPRQIRATWTPLRHGVHETAVRSVDGGKTWAPWFDLMFRPRSTGDSDDQDQVAALDTEYQAAVKNNDATTMDRLLAADFMLIVGTGTPFTKSELLDEARSGRVHYEHQESTRRRVRVWGDTAVVTALLHASGVTEGKAFDKTLWFSDTYIRTSSGWKYVFGQASLPLP